MNQAAMIKSLGSLTPLAGQECKPRYVLYGHGTYRHRFELAKLGWTWNEQHTAWYFDTSDAKDFALKFAKGLRNVRVTKLFVAKKQLTMGGIA